MKRWHTYLVLGRLQFPLLHIIIGFALKKLFVELRCKVAFSCLLAEQLTDLLIDLLLWEYDVRVHSWRGILLVILCKFQGSCYPRIRIINQNSTKLHPFHGWGRRLTFFLRSRFTCIFYLFNLLIRVFTQFAPFWSHDGTCTLRLRSAWWTTICLMGLCS